jgi:hypothetical protein
MLVGFGKLEYSLEVSEHYLQHPEMAGRSGKRRGCPGWAILVFLTRLNVGNSYLLTAGPLPAG